MEDNQEFLPLGGEIAFAGADLQVLLQGGNLDRAVAAVGVEVGGSVGDNVLAAQFVLDGGEGVRDVLHPERKEGSAAGGFGELLEHFVAAEDEAAIIGGDRVNNDFGTFRHFNGLRP
jgi:hypothetical protein